MTIIVRVIVVGAVVVLAAGAFELRAGASQGAVAAATVWDGVYTEAQAVTGERVYVQECSSCHGGSLEGADVAPGLVGGAFGANWSGLTLGDLSERIRTTMPADQPGRLSRQEVADVMAFVLKSNRWPAGSTALPAALAAQRQITIQASKP